MFYLALIYSWCGFDVGTVLRQFFAHSFNWGYYNDHDAYVYHSNFHPNNFLVLDESVFYDSNKEKSKIKDFSLLAPIDFDLAFFKEDFININSEKEPDED
jgi:hypothetical protein